MRVDQIEAAMSMREFIDWQRFESTEPLPDRLADIHAAMLCSIVVNLARASDAAPAMPGDFMVLRERKPPPDDGLTELDRQRKSWRGG